MTLTVLREIAAGARVADDAVVGPFCVVGPDVVIGPGTVLRRRVTVTAHTTLGRNNVLGEGCVLGTAPQDLKYEGSATLLIVGNGNRLGRDVTVHIGTEPGGHLTRIGDENVLDDGCHVAHDCYVDDRVHLGRRVQLAGHVRVQTGAVLEPLAAVHHFTTIGRYARVGAQTAVRRDVPPYTDYRQAGGDAAPAVKGVHEEGLAAAALHGVEEMELRRAVADLFDDESALQTRIEQLMNLGADGEVLALCAFCQRSLRGVYGRYRELFRGARPPEARDYLPTGFRPSLQRGLP